MTCAKPAGGARTEGDRASPHTSGRPSPTGSRRRITPSRSSRSVRRHDAVARDIHEYAAVLRGAGIEVHPCGQPGRIAVLTAQQIHRRLREPVPEAGPCRRGQLLAQPRRGRAGPPALTGSGTQHLPVGTARRGVGQQRLQPLGQARPASAASRAAAPPSTSTCRATSRDVVWGSGRPESIRTAAVASARSDVCRAAATACPAAPGPTPGNRPSSHTPASSTSRTLRMPPFSHSSAPGLSLTAQGSRATGSLLRCSSTSSRCNGAQAARTASTAARGRPPPSRRRR